jgi:hypothetical protein
MGANAAGEMGPTTLIMTMPKMRDGEFFAKRIIGMGGGSDIGSFGWIYFCNSRAGNAALWMHWFIHVVIPTLDQCRTVHKIKDEFGRAMRMVFSTDGEAIVLKQAFDEEILAMFEQMLADYLKNGPGMTSRHQAADVSDNFRDWKTGLETITRNNVNTKNDTLRRNLTEMFKDLAIQFPHSDVSSEYKKKIIFAVEKVVYCLRAKYVTPEKIVKGFVRCGQHVPDAEPGDRTVDYHKIMSLHLKRDGLATEGEVTNEHLDHMAFMRPRVMQEFRDRGRVVRAFLDKLQIFRDCEAVIRDELTLCRQDCQVITHADTVA